MNVRTIIQPLIAGKPLKKQIAILHMIISVCSEMLARVQQKLKAKTTAKRSGFSAANIKKLVDETEAESKELSPDIDDDLQTAEDSVRGEDEPEPEPEEPIS